MIPATDVGSTQAYKHPSNKYQKEGLWSEGKERDGDVDAGGQRSQCVDEK